MKFGTSGLRGLVPDLLSPDAVKYVVAFGHHLLSRNDVRPGDTVYIGGDLRPSTPQIKLNCIGALESVGFKVVDCGFLPTPALALFAMKNSSACLMITGSHIPADRNGIKFYTPKGEITKDDEASITALADELTLQSTDVAQGSGGSIEAAADALFLQRNMALLPPNSFEQLRIGVYQHSTVARDLLVATLTHYGATVIPLDRSEEFIPVDTEAVPASLVKLLKHWTETHQLDAIVSADGDGDRPLVADETGVPVRGDALGLLVARFLGAKVVATPVTSSSGIEMSGPYEVVRTKVGSPFVVEAMSHALANGKTSVVGFEANGGVLTADVFLVGGGVLDPLPTRDSFLPILVILSFVARQKRKMSRVTEALQLPYALSGLLPHCPAEKSAELMRYLRAGPENIRSFAQPLGEVQSFTDIDGLRVVLASGGTVHFRPSGNAPEMRCYTEADDAQSAEALLENALVLLKQRLI